MVLRPGGTYDSSPAIYRRVPEAHEARVPEGRPNTAAHAQAEDPPLLNWIASATIGTRANSRHQYRR
jgi:hypothetical protein